MPARVISAEQYAEVLIRGMLKDLVEQEIKVLSLAELFARRSGDRYL